MNKPDNKTPQPGDKREKLLDGAKRPRRPGYPPQPEPKRSKS